MLLSCGFFSQTQDILRASGLAQIKMKLKQTSGIAPSLIRKTHKTQQKKRKIGTVSTEKDLTCFSRRCLDRAVGKKWTRACELVFIYRQTPQYREIYRIPSRERSHIPPGEKQNHHLQKCLGRGYDSSQEGISKYYCVWYHIPQLVHFFHDRYA